MVSGDESWGPAKTETEDVIPDRFSVTKESEDAFRNCFARTTGRNAVTDVKYVTGNIGESHSFLGSIPHLHMLQLQVLAATLLAEVGAKFVDDFVLIRGPERVLETVIHYCKSDTSDHISMVGILLIFLNRLVASSLAVRSEMETRNALQFFLLLSERSADDLSKAQAIRAIALLCASRDCQTQLREQDGIQLLVLAIKRCVEPKKPLVGLRAGFKVGDKYHIDQVPLIYLDYECVLVKRSWE